MRSTILNRVVLAGLVAGGTTMISHGASAQVERLYEVTVYNATRGQPVTPPVAATHTSGFQLFEIGEDLEATPLGIGLRIQAEDGIPTDLVTALSGDPDVSDVAVLAGDPFGPGGTAVSTVTATGSARYLTLTAMLATTNDAFAAVRGVRLPKGIGDKVTVYGKAYDAGTEANSEDCTYIPGPPCDNGEVRDTGDAEGSVHIHSGVHGGSSLVPSDHDWRNPVIQVTIERIDGEE
jgi:hypothetical protein